VFAEMQVPRSKETLKERLARYRQIKISIIGGKSGHTMRLALAEPTGENENRV
jgi:hypothetical protein